MISADETTHTASATLQTLLEEILLHLERSAAASTSRGDRLTIAWISHVASGKDTLHTGERSPLLRYDVARCIQLELTCEEVRIGLVSDSQEEAIDRYVTLSLLGRPLFIYEVSTLHAIVAKESDRVVLKEHLYVLPCEESLLHHLRGAQMILAHDQVDLLSETRQVERLLTSRVATAHDSDTLLAIEEAVARSACRDAHASILRLIV